MKIESPHLVIVGAGHASLPLLKEAKKLLKAGFKLTVLSETDTLFYSGMVPEYLGGVYTLNEISIHIPSFFKSLPKKNSQWIEEEVLRIDAEQNLVHTKSGQSISYDLLICDTGSRNPDPPSSSVVRSKPLVDLIEDWNKQSHGKNSKVSIIGGGAAGCEIALNLSSRFPQLSLQIFDANERILSLFPSKVSEKVSKLLSDRNVSIQTGIRIEANHPVFSDPLTKIIWTTGTVSHPIYKNSKLKTDSRGFLKVNQKLQIPEYPNIWASGDGAAIETYPELQKIGVHAVKQGPLLLENALRWNQGKPLKPFKPYPLNPLIFSTGSDHGIWVEGKLWFKNRFALALKHYIDQKWIAGYNDFPFTLASIIHTFFGKERRRNI